MSRKVHVDLAERSYDIRIGKGEAVSLPALSGRDGLALVVTDSNVGPLYGAECEAQCGAAGWTVARVDVPAGEATKDLQWTATLYDKAAEAGLDRRSCIIALGGGVIGDLAGFVAATYLRGVRLIQVPTSLLAMVDSSVGGKTGVNLKSGKNLVGSFYQPAEVVIDLSKLATLPQREYLSGLAEVVKYGVIWDANLFRFLEGHVAEILAREAAALEKVVARCCEIKAEVVGIDERETGVRAILNFGHTLGHAVEQVTGYGRYLHGEAVAVGMAYAGQLSCRMKGLSPEPFERMIGLLTRLGLPVRPADTGLSEGDWEALRQAMSSDKKSQASRPRFVLAEKIGSVVFGCEVDEQVMRETWQVMCGGESAGQARK